MLESWRANIVIAGVSREDAGDREAMNQAGNEKIGDENDKSEVEVNKKEGKIEGGGKQGAKDQADKEKEGNEPALAYDSREVAEALAESVTLTERDMAEWKEAFDQEMAAEPNFRSKRAWTARVSESQKEAKTLEEQVRKLEVYKSEWVAKSTMQAADHLLDELQKFRVELRMDRKAFWDEFDQEGSELLLRDTEAEQNTEDEVQEEAQQDEAQEIGVGGENSQTATSEAEKDDAQMTGIEEHKARNQLLGYQTRGAAIARLGSGQVINKKDTTTLHLVPTPLWRNASNLPMSLPQDTSLSTPGIRSGGVEGTDSEPKQTTDQTSTTSLPQDTSPTTSGIRTGSDAGIGGGENESTVDDHARSTSDAGALPQGSTVGGETDSPPAVSIGQSPIVVPNMRYIRPQWESFAGLEEPTYGANDYSANEVDDDEEEDEDEDETDEVDYWGVDDVDP
ncbi:hypothetical protein UCDDA912_g10000 [Diaporthe ampelina]|uniref:Uncharacterized protein n=1 Tax=Diaporthe ampelina TaxID=1214573 RepID=A0A0G2H493_9PEZI|nr:hypothetical protein UCDDA912_g10000 [Diaporthe ampelina]